MKTIPDLVTRFEHIIDLHDKELRVMFLWNGLTCVFDGLERNAEQVPELQRPWITLFAEFLESKGYNPVNATFELPDGQVVKLFRTDDGGFNWKFE